MKNYVKTFEQFTSEETIFYNGNTYLISDDEIVPGDMYINYSNYKRGVKPEDLKYIIGTSFEISPVGGDMVIHAEEFKTDLLSSCKKLVLLS